MNNMHLTYIYLRSLLSVHYLAEHILHISYMIVLNIRTGKGVAEIIRQQQQLVQKLTQVQQELEITKTELTTNKIEVGKLKRLLDDQEESFSAKVSKYLVHCT